jgi:hypothetical protein
MKRKAFVRTTAAAAFVPKIAAAQALAPADAIARLFTAPQLQAAWFTPVFLAGVSLVELKAILADITGALGPYQSIAPNGKRFTLTFARGTVQADASLDAGGVLAGLLFSRMQSPLAADRVSGVFRTVPIPANWFGDRFLAAVPIEKMRAIVAAIQLQYGAFQHAMPAADGTYDITFANGRAAVLVFLDAAGKITGFIAQPR